MHPAFYIDCPRCGETIEPADDCPFCGNHLGAKSVRRTFGPVRQVHVKDEWRIEDALEDELLSLIETARRGGLRGLVLVHGWGSSGVGGRLRRSVREELAIMIRMDQIRDWRAGEQFESLDDVGLGGSRRGSQQLQNAARSWFRNPGISFVTL